MPLPLVWTEQADDTLHGLRAEGATWEEIAVVLRIDPRTAAVRAKRIGVAKRPRRTQAPRLHRDLRRDALPPGDPLSWGLLTNGTLLTGAAFDVPGHARVIGVLPAGAPR
jgi:hypothetical protein